MEALMENLDTHIRNVIKEEISRKIEKPKKTVYTVMFQDSSGAWDSAWPSVQVNGLNQFEEFQEAAAEVTRISAKDKFIHYFIKQHEVDV